MSVGVYIGIVYILPTIGGLYVSCFLLVYSNWGDTYKLFGVFGPSGPSVWGVVCQLVYRLVLYISCQQLGGCILYISCLVSRVGGYMSVGVYNGIVYIIPKIGGLYVSFFYIGIVYIMPTIGRI